MGPNTCDFSTLMVEYPYERSSDSLYAIASSLAVHEEVDFEGQLRVDHMEHKPNPRQKRPKKSILGRFLGH
jgi:hypothetical protein